MDRHHKNGDVFDNRPNNIERLCRRCHMQTDGRLDALIERNHQRPRRNQPKPCTVCRRDYYPLRRGRCHSCDMYRRRTGREKEIA